MKKNLFLLLFLVSTFSGLAQSAKINGTVTDTEEIPLEGARVTIEGTSLGRITNESGYFTFTNLESGPVTIIVSYLGYETQAQSIEIGNGIQEVKFVMKNADLELDGVIISAQKRPEELIDVPIAISVLGSERLESINSSNLDELSDFVPGLNIQVQSTQRPGYVIRGLTSDGNDPNVQPRVSIYFDNLPISRASGAVIEPYDLERIEVLKGPQGTLFGRGAQIGAVHFITAKPKNRFDAGAKVGYGSYNSTNATAFVNAPITDNFYVRAAGTFDRMDGFVRNTFGGTLNGKNTVAGRLSLRFLPSTKLMADLMVDFQNDDAPGVAFVTKVLPNTNGESGVFSEEVSLEQGEDLGTSKQNITTALTVNYDLGDKFSLTSVSSLRWHEAYERYDGDGSAARTLDFSEANLANQVYQEIRLNAALGNRFNGVLGGSYFMENVDREFVFRFDERSVATFFFTRDATNLVDENGQPVLVPALPPTMGGTLLPDNHIESRFQDATNSSVQIFLDGTLDLSEKFSLTGGIRLMQDQLSISEKNEFVNDTSVLGQLTRRSPNLFSPILNFPETTASSLGLTGRLVLMYAMTDQSNIYTSYARGRRPEVIEFRNDGTTELLAAEIVDNFEIGYKASLAGRVRIGFAAFFHDYSNFRTTAFIHPDSLTAGGTPETFQSNAGNASTYGTELDLDVLVTENITLFGNYAYIHARFDEIDSDGKEQAYAGNMFRLTPDHSFSVGANASFRLTSSMSFFLVPTYSFKSMHFFDDSNPVDSGNPTDVSLSMNQFQEAYGILNMNTGITLDNLGIKVTLFGKNLLDKEYVIDAGNTGAAILGLPTYVRGRPRMFGAKLEWTLN